MQVLIHRTIRLVLLSVILFSASTTLIFAEDTVAGSIVITGSVPPQAASIVTQLSVSPSAGELHQDQILTYTLYYSSTNVTTVPVTLQIEWEKGKVEGASESNVDAVEYVPGTATAAYGVTPAIVDTHNKRITWEISALPAGVGTQTVTFQLKTTKNYTGPLKVSVPVVGKVLVPSGVSDKKIVTNYIYSSSSESIVESISNPNVSPTPSSDLLFSPSPVVVPNVSSSSQRKVTSVVIRSIGMGSAKVTAVADLGVDLELFYGDAPTNLATSIKSDSSTADHELYITNLNPDSQYYFTVAPVGSTGDKVIFTFKTATGGTAGLNRNATSVTVSQNRSVIYSADTANKITQPATPMVVLQNTVIDLFLNITDSKEITTFEVEIRPQLVLGESTEKFETDALQSLTTKVTQISDGFFVGKVRTPVTAGKYILVSRIEDIYGNLSEAELSSIIVTNPMLILDKKSGQPIEHARVELKMFNQKINLYEMVSNVTSSVSNPTYSNNDGVVDLNLLPAKYSVKVSALGYVEQEVEFEVGRNEVSHFPKIELERTRTPFGVTIGTTSRTVIQEWLQLIEHYHEISKSHTVYNLLFFVNSVLCIACSWQLWWKKSSKRMSAKLNRYVSFGIEEVVVFTMNLYLLNALILSLYFADNLSLIRGLAFMLWTGIAVVLWLKLLWKKRMLLLHNQSI